MHEGPRSAEPPSNHGTFFAITFNTLPDASRVAIPFGIRWERWQPLVTAFGELATEHAITLIRELRVFLPVNFKLGHPCVPQRPAACADPRLKVFTHAVGHKELGIRRPAVMALRQPDFFFAQRLAVRSAGVLFIRRAVRNVAINNDQGGSALIFLESAKGAIKHFQVVGISHPRHVPPIAHEPRGRVVAIAQSSVAFDGDMVVVVDPAQVGEPEVPCQ